MDEIDSSNGQFVTIRTSHDGQFPQAVSSTQAINMSISQPDITYQGGINFDTIKQESAGNLELQSTAVLPIKPNLQVVTSDLFANAETSESHKIITGQPTFVPVSHAMNVNSSGITLSSLEALGSSSTLGGTNVPIYHLSSFDNCGTVLRQQAQPNQSFIINSTDSILSASSIQPPEELVYLPTSVDNHSDTHFVNTLPSSSTQPARLILQTNQVNQPTHQLLTNNSAPIFLHVGSNTVPTPVQSSGISVNNKGHIIIKSGSTKAKQEPLTSTNEGVVKILVRDSYSKAPAPTVPVPQVSNEESVRQHVQINLPSKQPKVLQYNSLPNQASSSAISQTYPKDGTTAHKLYSCPNCDIQFLKALNLRLHKRECNKPEAKPEKIPSYMCAFCKTVFKGSSQVHNHFSSCSEHPNYGGKDKPKTGKNSDVEKKLAFPVLIKCQDCDRTFSKERQYASHLRRCSEVNFNDLSGSKGETAGEENGDGGGNNEEDPFADPPSFPSKRGRGNSGGRRGRPPGRSTVAARSAVKTNVLFEGVNVSEASPGLVVLDNDNIVRSTSALAHTVNLTLDTAIAQGKPQPHILVSNPNGVKAKGKIPQAWSLICSLCQKMFVAKEALACHIMDQHGNELIAAKDVLLGNMTHPHTLYRCPLCILNFQSEDKIIEHLVLRHTGRLQDCYSELQTQTGTFVCSICSIVLLTKNLLLEHISLQHLDELLLGSNKAKANERRLKENATPVVSADNEDSWDGDLAPTTPVTNSCKLPLNADNPTECCFCLDTFLDEQKLYDHYVSCHEMETDANGCIVDTGIDVDVRVKDTQNLLLIAGTKMADGTPEKTVLIGKKPKKSFSANCHTCHKHFNRQDTYYRHVQEGCLPSSSDGSKCLSSTERNFFCKFKECNHLVYNQVKSLFKHMYDAHAITVPKERRTFRNLQSFNQWLEVHSQERNVQFVTENSRIEKGLVSFSQMVCEKFHSSRANQAKEKVAELSKPTKKRLSVRTARIEDCYARIHLRTAYNCNTSLYDGETQMIYYPEHSHLKDGPLQEVEKLDEIGQKRKRNGAVVSGQEDSMLTLELDQELLNAAKRPASAHGKLALPSTSYAENLVCFSSQNGSSNFEFTTSNSVTTPNVIMVQSGPKKSNEFLIETTNSAGGSHSSNILDHQQVDLGGQTLPSNAVLVQSGNTILVHNHPDPSANSNKSLLIDNDDNSSFIVQDNLIMNMNHQEMQSEESQDYADEFVLPADAEEWTKLFGLLRDRLMGDELCDEDKKAGQTLLTYENVITAIGVHDQASIFQKLCTITGTAIESS